MAILEKDLNRENEINFNLNRWQKDIRQMTNDTL